MTVNNHPLPICDFPYKLYSSVFEAKNQRAKAKRTSQTTQSGQDVNI